MSEDGAPTAPPEPGSVPDPDVSPTGTSDYASGCLLVGGVLLIPVAFGWQATSKFAALLSSDEAGYENSLWESGAVFLYILGVACIAIAIVRIWKRRR